MENMAKALTTIDLLLPLLEHLPLGIFSDIDGTLAPIVPRPEDARVSPRNRELLSALIERGVRVALITGRTLKMGRAMSGLDGAVYGANHGLELWVEGRSEHPADVDDFVAAARLAREDFAELAIEGLVIEDKGPIVALHYRNSPDESAARSAILAAIGRSRAAKRFVIQEGRKVIEMRPPVDVNKGTALESLASRLAVRSLLCLGDDRTDIDMFQTAARLRDSGTPGATVAVLSEETAPEVVDAADYSVEGVVGVERLLNELLSALR